MKFTYRMFEKEIEYEDGNIVKLSEGMNRTMMFFYIHSGKIYDLQIVADYVYTMGVSNTRQKKSLLC